MNQEKNHVQSGDNKFKRRQICFIIKSKPVIDTPLTKYQTASLQTSYALSKELTQHFNYGFNPDTMHIYQKVTKKISEAQSLNPKNNLSHYDPHINKQFKFNDQIPMQFGGFGPLLHPQSLPLPQNPNSSHGDQMMKMMLFSYLTKSYKSNHNINPLIQFVENLNKKDIKGSSKVDKISYKIQEYYNKSLSVIQESKNREKDEIRNCFGRDNGWRRGNYDQRNCMKEMNDKSQSKDKSRYNRSQNRNDKNRQNRQKGRFQKAKEGHSQHFVKKQQQSEIQLKVQQYKNPYDQLITEVTDNNYLCKKQQTDNNLKITNYRSYQHSVKKEQENQDYQPMSEMKRQRQRYQDDYEDRPNKKFYHRKRPYENGKYQQSSREEDDDKHYKKVKKQHRERSQNHKDFRRERNHDNDDRRHLKSKIKRQDEFQQQQFSEQSKQKRNKHKDKSRSRQQDRKNKRIKKARKSIKDKKSKRAKKQHERRTQRQDSERRDDYKTQKKDKKKHKNRRRSTDYLTLKNDQRHLRMQKDRQKHKKHRK